MKEKRKKTKRYVWLAILLLVVTVLAVNFFRTHWVENYLAHKLIERTSAETDGFYNLSYRKLSISFLNGELKIEGVKLVPDSAVFAEWAGKDSLPNTYMDLSIEMIHFKGLNLTWRHDFKKLHFKAFQIEQPNIKIFQTGESIHPKKKHQHAASKNVYQMISRYIAVLSVDQLNLDNASVLFTAVNPKSPIVYSIQNVSFDAYGFCLDEQTYENGKLLFCDNFCFTTHQPQELLSNNDFTLNTDSISLSTADSLIYIGNIRLNSTRLNPGYPENSLDAMVKTVLVSGIQFDRKEALNSLTIRSFDIESPEIETSHLVHKTSIEEVQRRDTHKDENLLEQPLSIYDIISPLLQKLVIEEIDIDKAKLKYTVHSPKGKDLFQVDALTFKVYELIMDSVAMSDDQYLFSQNFELNITGLSGEMESSNHRIDIKQVDFNSTEGDLTIREARLRPISTHTSKDYIIGDVEEVQLKGLNYANGIEFQSFSILHPVIEYTMMAKTVEKPKKGSEKKKETKPLNLKGIFSPLMNHLSLKSFRIEDAGFIVKDRRAPQSTNYKLENLNLFATDLLLKESKQALEGYTFSYGKIGFSFTDFDNILPGNAYRLTIDKGSYSTTSELFSLNNIALLPQDTLFDNSKSYLRFLSPLLTISGLDGHSGKNKRDVSFERFYLQCPEVDLHDINGSHYSATLQDLSIDSLFWSKASFSIGAINLAHPVIDIYSRLKHKKAATVEEHKAFKLPTLSLPDSLYRSLSGIAEEFSLDRFAITDARINLAVHSKDTTTHIDIDTVSLAIYDIELNTQQRTFGWQRPYFSIGHFSYPLDGGMFDIGFKSIKLMDDSLYICGLSYTSPYSKMEFSYVDPKHKSWYDVTIQGIALAGLNLPEILNTHTFKLKDMRIEVPTLQNFVNQKTKLPRHKLFPMIYSYLQKAPIGIDIPVIYVNDFSVIYEELSRKGSVAGQLLLQDMSGTISNVTNIVNPAHPYIIANLNGRLMGKGKFDIVWEVPVDSLNDHFHLGVEMSEFDLREMNQLVSPLAPLEIKSGHLTKLTLSADASSQKAKADMLMQYENLHGEVIHYKDSTIVENRFASLIADKLLQHENKERHAIIEIERDPYHPTFNYIWQIMEPALIESIGFSEEVQEDAVHAIKFLDRVKHFFRPKAKKSHFNYPDLILPGEKE